MSTTTNALVRSPSSSPVKTSCTEARVTVSPAAKSSSMLGARVDSNSSANVSVARVRRRSVAPSTSSVSKLR